MALVQLDPSLLSTLHGRVVVLTGGAIGIGRCAVEQFHSAGAKIVFGDIQDSPGQALESQLGRDRARYVHCDTTSYAEQLRLFETAEKEFGRVDVVVANAAIAIHKDPFDPEADISVEPPTAEIDVNLKGALFTARIGMHYLRKTPGGGDLILVSSIAGFKESSGLVAYTASKHGVLGLLRGLRITAMRRDNIRINAICPWMTKTRMVRGIERGWYERNLPTNEPEDVARAILVCATANRCPDGTHPGARLPFAGKILWIGGGKAYEIEDKLQELELEWLGRENSAVLARGQAFLEEDGTSWDVEKRKSHI